MAAQLWRYRDSDDGGSSWYTKLHNHFRVNFSKKAINLLVSNKNLSWFETDCLAVMSFLKILFEEIK